MSASKAAAIKAGRSGVYRSPRETDALRLAAEKTGLAWMNLPLQAVSNKKQFLEICARQLKLPSYFGGNWDALADCTRDLSWLKSKGYVVHITGQEKFAAAAPEDFKTALQVLTEAAEFWKGTGVPFVVLVDGAQALPDY